MGYGDGKRDFSQRLVGALAETLHTQHIVARGQIGKTRGLLTDGRAPLPVEALKIALVYDVVLIAVVDAFEMYHQAVFTVA